MPPQRATQVDPDEDEETRQYRLKLEEQKRLREKILKQKEERRQMQAGVRKQELMRRINAAQTANQNQTPPAQNQDQPQQKTPPAQAPIPQIQTPQQIPSLTSNGANQPPPASAIPTLPRPNVKTRLQMARGAQSQVQPTSAQHASGPNASQQGQWQQQRRGMMNQGIPQGGAVQHGGPIEGQGPGQGQALAQAPRPGGKRTVMQRQNMPGSPQLPHKVRVVKLPAGGDAQETPPAVEQPQPIGRLTPQPRQMPLRKVTMGAGSQQQQVPVIGQGGRGSHPHNNRVVMPGRGGRGRGGRGAVRMMATRQGGRGGGTGGGGSGSGGGGGQEGLLTTVSIDGLSTSTTEKQLRNLLQSIGPIQMFKMHPQQRKAVAKFFSPEHAQSFQHSFHRHMIDLSHIDVSLING